MSRAHTIGFECELDGVPSQAFVEPLKAEGLWTSRDTEIHMNHCTCAACRWGGSRLRPMTDSSCEGELVSDPIPWPDPTSHALLTQLEEILAAKHAQPGRRAGFHVHVAYPTRADLDQEQIKHHLMNWYIRYEPGMAVFGRQSLPGVRPYNRWLRTTTHHANDGRLVTIDNGQRPRARSETWTKPHEIQSRDSYMTVLPSKGEAIAFRTQTLEFRFWNSVVEAWRMYLAIEVSCAFIDAAMARKYTPLATMSYPPTLIEFIAPYIDAQGLGYATRHLATIADQEHNQDVPSIEVLV